MPQLTTAFLALAALLGTLTLLAQTHPSTPADALKALIDAIDRGDLDEVGALIELPLKLEKDDLSLMAQRYILGSELYWLVEAKFGQRDAQRVMRRGRLDYLPRVDAERLEWELLESPLQEEGSPPVAIGSVRSGHGLVRMVKRQEGWKASLSYGSTAILVLDVQDTPWRNRVLQQAIDELKAGDETTIQQVIDLLIPRAPEQTEPVKADRSTPAGAMLVAAESIETGDPETLADSFEMICGDDGGFLRRMAEQAVLERKVENLVRARYPAEQAERIVRDGTLRRGLLVMYQDVDGWIVDGDVARAALKEQWYDVVRRMVRRDGIWRIQLPPRSTIPAVDDQEERLKQQARMRILRDVLDHPDRFATAGDMLEALDPSRQEMAAQQADAGAAARQQLEQIKQEMEQNPPKTPQEADEQALALSLWELGTAVASKDANAAARHYFVEGDDGAYALARINRLIAAQEMLRAASREIDSGAGGLLSEFHLVNFADDIYGLFMVELKIQGDRAVPTGDTQGEWIPPIRRIAGEWKIDVTEETRGNPKAAAKRADDETKKLLDLTIQVKAGKFSNLDQLRNAMKDAGIKGSPVPTQ